MPALRPTTPRPPPLLAGRALVRRAGSDMAGSPRTPCPLARPDGGNSAADDAGRALAAAHLDGDPTNNRRKNLRALCQRCHMLHDQPHHLAQCWITYRRRQAVGDLFLGQYPTLIVALASKRTTGELGYVGSVSPGPPYAALDARAVRAALRGGAALRTLSIAGRCLPVRTAAPGPRLPA